MNLIFRFLFELNLAVSNFELELAVLLSLTAFYLLYEIQTATKKKSTPNLHSYIFRLMKITFLTSFLGMKTCVCVYTRLYLFYLFILAIRSEEVLLIFIVFLDFSKTRKRIEINL